MKIKKNTAIWLITTLLVVTLGLSGCGSDSSSIDDASNVPVSTEDFKISEINESVATGNDYVTIDASHVSAGYLCIRYAGDNEKPKLQMKHDGDTYTYNLNTDGQYAVFPLSCGDGNYKVEVYENISGNQYAQVFAESLDVALDDETFPFLYPNNYVNYDGDSKVVPLTYQVTENSQSQLDVVEDVYAFVTDKISYDYEKAANPGEGYVPNLDEVIDTKTGICFDYASLMSAMLRIRNIPTKLVVGYSGDVYHAWISVYISDVGWIDNAIEFDGNQWTLMDPTYAASSQAGSEADYVKNKNQYHALFFY